jgi:hypothetical protein
MNNTEFKKLNADQQELSDLFLFGHTGPHRTQTPVQALTRSWTNHNAPTNDKLLIQHCDGEQTIAKIPAWYPIFGNIDIDSPRAQEKPVLDKMQEIGIGADQFACFTTPRFRSNGNFRIYFNFQLHGKPVTARLYEDVLKNQFGQIQNLEYNPRHNAADRLIGGFDCHLVDTYSKQITKVNLRETLDVLKGIKPVEISELPIGKLPEIKRVSNVLETSGSRNEFIIEAEDLLQNGLQKNSCTRHFAQGKVLFLLWLKNAYNEVSAAEFVKNWIRLKHNGFSKTVNSGDWRNIDRAIERQAKSIFVTAANKLPDAVHNRIVSATSADVIAAAKYAPGEAVRQKQFFNLLKVIRPNFKHEWIYIPWHTWVNDIASAKTYRGFQMELLAKGLMVADWRYKKDVESRKFKFNFKLESGAGLTSNGRNVDCYYDALKTLCAGNRREVIREIHSLTGITKKTLREHVNKE